MFNKIYKMFIFSTVFLNIFIFNSAQILNNINNNIKSDRILNGLNTEKNEFPFIVSIRYEEFFHRCGGSIITDRHILTAAHCLINGMVPEQYTVYIGSNKLSNGIPKSVAAVTAHSEYTGAPDWWKHDLAIFELEDTLTFSDTVSYINISTTPVNDNENLIIAGWGLRLKPSFTYPNVQQKLSTTVCNFDNCKQFWPEISEKQLCLWNGSKSIKGFCQGDSGGPIINSNNELVGIISWGRGDCDQEKPDVGVKLSPYYLKWIEKVVKNL